MTNTNCLAGMQCPGCKSSGPFNIAAMALFTIDDDGAADFGDLEYDDGSYCKCPACDFDGIVEDFRKKDPAAGASPSGKPGNMDA